MPLEPIVLFVIIVIALLALAFLVNYFLEPNQRLNVRLTVSRMQLTRSSPFIRRAPSALYDPGKHPPQAEWSLRNAYLSRLGVSRADRQALLGSRHDFYTREQSARNVRTYCRNLKKASGK